MIGFLFSLPYGIEEVIFKLKTMNVSTILGHPERSQKIQKNPKRIPQLVNAGAFVQVTAGSFCGYFGERAKWCALELAKLGALHAVASDAHSLEKRLPIITEGLRVLEELIGRDRIKSLVADLYRFIGLESDDGN